MAEEKKARFKYTTPVGTLRYPNLNTPRAFVGKPNPKTGKMPKPGAPKFDCGWFHDDPKVMKKVEKDIEKGMESLGWAKGEGTPWKKDAKSGQVYLKAQTGEKYRPVVQDAKCNDIPLSVEIGGGSTGRLSITLDYYDGFGGGITAYLNGVQIAKLNEFKKGPGFDEIEGDEITADEDEGNGGGFSEIPDASDMHDY